MGDELGRTIADARPDGDPIARSVRLARVTGALFGSATATSIGRYELKHQLARGGGGTVYVARDPELDRDVAIKLIRFASEAQRERALAEGRVLAKLAHPNVVPVFDVGASETHVYLVMELVRGPSLRERATADRTIRELVAAYREAGLGLVAAHDVGVIHRDFKPDNAILGEDGRVRVVDFGLAIGAHDGASTTIAGTPRYMAPEQRDGEAIGAAADQYALAVSLREALGDRALPSWLGRVLARASAAEPPQRYPHVRDLVRELGNDPRRTWLRRGAIAAPLILAAAGFAIGRERDAGEAGPAPCSGGAELIAPAWSPDRVAAASSRIAGLGTPFATVIAPLVRDRAQATGERWIAAHRHSCLAHERRELTGELFDRSTVCLGRARRELGETLALLETASPSQLEPALTALGLIETARCLDPVALAGTATPGPSPAGRELERQIDIAQLHTRAGPGRAIELAEAAVRTARIVAERAPLARALLVLGHARLDSDQAGAIAPLEEATLVALASGRDELAAEAHARKMWAAGFVGSDSLRPLDSLPLAKAIAQRAGDRGQFARALLANNAGSLKIKAGQFDLARQDFGEALELGRKVTGPEAVELVNTVSNLATIARDRAERSKLFALAVAIIKLAVGPDHSQTLIKQLAAVLDDDDPHRVVRALASLCPRLATLHPQQVAVIETCAFELAWQATALGDAAEVGRAVAVVRSPMRATDSRQLALASYAGDVRIQDLEAARDRETAKIASLGWFQRIYAADVELALAASALPPAARARAARAAILHLDQVVAITGAPYGRVLRRRAWAEALVRNARH
ncbi:MAG: serine/threonine-protein kinase [Kofleriaceae bacterium]